VQNTPLRRSCLANAGAVVSPQPLSQPIKLLSGSCSMRMPTQSGGPFFNDSFSILKWCAFVRARSPSHLSQNYRLVICWSTCSVFNRILRSKITVHKPRSMLNNATHSRFRLRSNGFRPTAHYRLGGDRSALARFVDVFAIRPF
jgi:hypothetical protein